MDLMRKAEDESKKQESALATKVSSNEVEVCICDLILVITFSQRENALVIWSDYCDKALSSVRKLPLLFLTLSNRECLF